MSPPSLPYPERWLCCVIASSSPCLRGSLGSRVFPSSQELEDVVLSWINLVLITWLESRQLNE